MTPTPDASRIRTLLVPLDGSSLAEQALPTAVRIAARDGAMVHVVQVHLPPAYGEFPGWAGMDTALRDDEQQYLESVARRLRERHGVDTRTELLEDPVRDALCGYVATEHIDVIVMTTHGRTGLRRAWLGSVADGMVRESMVPVLMVRPSAKRARQRRVPEFTRILVPLDGSSSAEAILPHALAVGAPAGKELILVRVVEPVSIPLHPYPYAASATRPDAEAIERLVTAASNYLETVADQMRSTRGPTRVRTRVYVDRRPGKAILDAATSYAARLVAMTTHGRGATRLLVGSVADKVLRGISVPLLLYRPPSA